MLDRQALRAGPPPLLVTNLTMLEYLLVRGQDAPILEQSRGLLEYVILDEVHTYIGVQATELALLLRRVALAFGSDPRTIRVIATSATLGTGERQEQEAQLRQFLRDLTGADPGTVHAVIGERAPLDLPAEAPAGRFAASVLDGLPDEAAWKRLAPAPQLQAIARRLHRGERIPWSEWRRVSQDTLALEVEGEAGARALLTACARAKRPGDGQVFLPVRMHVFERTLSGLWACCDPACPGRPAGKPADWNFGKIFLDRCDLCDACGAPVLEVRICQACGTEALAGEETGVSSGTGRRLHAPAPEVADDDFALELDLPDTGEDPAPEPEPAPALRMARWILPQAAPRTVRLAVRRKTGEILEFPRARCRAACIARRRFRWQLSVVRGAEPWPPDRAPVPDRRVLHARGRCSRRAWRGQPRQRGGRKTFLRPEAPDLHRCAAGHRPVSAKLQADAERAFLRAFAYHAVQSKPPAGTPGEIAAKRKEIAALEAAASPALAGILDEARADLADLEGSADAKPVSWPDMRDRLAQDHTLLHIKTLWELREDAFQDPGDLAHFLLLREFLPARRPGKLRPR